ncbi:hypothetical protein DNTS_006290 [Danionella cerebrum]|uniref:Uncharacterized protein n=1 Tax=Danionella cerebrum TaxID=2873325 RepID=A0A553Q208_9TELE|nr:hypothetical protein DNTS_006290 [Danionella translucida]
MCPELSHEIKELAVGVLPNLLDRKGIESPLSQLGFSPGQHVGYTVPYPNMEEGTMFTPMSTADWIEFPDPAHCLFRRVCGRSLSVNPTASDPPMTALNPLRYMEP